MFTSAQSTPSTPLIRDHTMNHQASFRPTTEKRKQLNQDKVVDHAPKKKRVRRRCSADECANIAVNGGVCVKHGAKVKTCSHEGCTNNVQKQGVCIKHGAKVTKKRMACNHEGCTNWIRKRGVCRRHGQMTCSQKGCKYPSKEKSERCGRPKKSATVTASTLDSCSLNIHVKQY